MAKNGVNADSVERACEPANKLDGDKVPLDLLPFEALEELGRVLGHGARKYAAHNWRKGMSWSRPLAASLRHIFAFARGEDIDADSGAHHLACAMCEMAFLLTYALTKTGNDDRWTRNQKEKKHG